MDGKELMGKALANLGNTTASPRKSKCRECDREYEYDVYPDSRCPECTIKAKARARESRIKNADHIAGLVFPPKFRNLDYKLPAMFESLPKDESICLTGPCGTGKTTAIALLVKKYFQQEASRKDVLNYSSHEDWSSGRASYLHEWRFISYPAFIIHLQSSFKRDDDPEEILKRVAEARYLIIDDIGAEKPTEFVRQATYYLINEREMNMRTTFITTNFDLDYLDQNIDPRIASRIAGMCKVIKMAGKDRRLQK